MVPKGFSSNPVFVQWDAKLLRHKLKNIKSLRLLKQVNKLDKFSKMLEDSCAKINTVFETVKYVLKDMSTKYQSSG